MSRKSIILYLDSLDVLDKLTDEQCSELFKGIRDYNLGLDIKLSNLVDIVFTQFKNQFDRDKEKYEKICERNKINGSKGGRPKTQKNPVGSLVTQRNPKNLDNDSDSDNDIKKEIKKKKEPHLDLFESQGYDLTLLKQLIEHRKLLKKPILTNRMMKGLLKSLEDYSKHWNISFSDSLDYYLSKSWISIDKEYKYQGRTITSPESDISWSDINKRLKEKQIEYKGSN